MSANGPESTPGSPGARDDDASTAGRPDATPGGERPAGSGSRPDFTPAGSGERGREAGPDDATTTLPRYEGSDRSSTEQTSVLPTTSGGERPRGTTGSGRTGDTDAADDRAAARARRQQALGVREPAPAEEDHEPTVDKRSTDRFLGSLGLFLLRLVVAVIMGVHGAQKLLDIDGTTQFFASTALPYPEVFALVTAIGEVLVALALVLGLLVRVAGLGIVAISVGALVFVYWYRWPFSDQPGFQGELELLLAAVGFLLFCLGGGWWGIDAAMRRGRARRRAGA
ncbi:DoxX family protein [Desertihabitans brevis]|uniref:DoxX family protein n=1 Tax=Desertihabitans brevis TaxID=2268447 RepID=A0A367YTY1_9ACTN|nr:DoxX family protein [Desertihabitans brevis]RCK69217.1 DoxX family protein [Desertihabitans brevis]